MSVDEIVDDALIGALDLDELQSHAVAPIAPGDAPLGVDVALGAGEAKPQPHVRAVLERARRPDRDPAATQVQGQCRGNRVAEAIRDGNTQYHTRAATPVEIVGEKVGRE